MAHQRLLATFEARLLHVTRAAAVALSATAGRLAEAGALAVALALALLDVARVLDLLDSRHGLFLRRGARLATGFLGLLLRGELSDRGFGRLAARVADEAARRV